MNRKRRWGEEKGKKRQTDLKEDADDLADGLAIVESTVMATDKVQTKGLEHDKERRSLVCEREPRICVAKLGFEIKVFSIPPFQGDVLPRCFLQQLDLQIPHSVRHDAKVFGSQRNHLSPHKVIELDDRNVNCFPKQPKNEMNCRMNE